MIVALKAVRHCFSIMTLGMCACLCVCVYARETSRDRLTDPAVFAVNP